MTLLFAAPEMTPFCKTGGLADVVGALTPVLSELGHGVHVMLPGYRSIDRRKYGFCKLDTSCAVSVGNRRVPCGISSASLNGVAIYLLENDEYFGRAGLYGDAGGDYPDNGERFVFFSRAVLETAKALSIQPEIIHAHDWQAGLVLAYLSGHSTGMIRSIKTPAPSSRSIISAIRETFRTTFFRSPASPQRNLPGKNSNSTTAFPSSRGGIVYADAVSTVSRTYAGEITRPELGFGLDGLFRERRYNLYGIVNGIDLVEWNPATDRAIAARFSADDLSGKKKCRGDVLRLYGLKAGGTVPVIGMVSRLDDQKGFDILEAAVEQIVSFDVRLIILGTGTSSHETAIRQLAERFPGAVGAILKFDNSAAHKVYAGADVFLMPSRYEPCGLGQLIAMRYGTLPVVHATGGLADTVTDMDDDPAGGTGFVFREKSPDSLGGAVMRAVAMFHRKGRMRWTQAIRRAMARDSSWEKSAQEYRALYEQIRNRRNR